MQNIRCVRDSFRETKGGAEVTQQGGDSQDVALALRTGHARLFFHVSGVHPQPFRSGAQQESSPYLGRCSS